MSFCGAGLQRCVRSRTDVLLHIGLCALLFAMLAAPLHAQERPRHGRLFSPENLGELEGPDRDAWQMPDAIMDALGIADGAAVADIGAGGGWFTVRLARRVGPNGMVYAQDVQVPMLEAIQRRVDREGLKNVRTIKGEVGDPRLPASSVDVVLIVDTYHEFTNPVELLRHLAAALKPGGRIAVINATKEGGGPGPPVDERKDQAEVLAEAERAGLTLVRKETFLPFQYFLVLGRPASAGSSAAATETGHTP
jgi:2-polyprenyl-3-methyl-5-hydroxy-6-metoxy-1,4-benzoquinol methylase